MVDRELTRFIETYKSLVVIPDTSLDSLISAGILMKRLLNHGLDVKITLDTTFLINYPSDPVIVINLPPLSRERHLYIERSKDSSTTGIVVKALDKLTGVDRWDKLLAVIMGLYRNLYDFKQGKFHGVEDEFVKDLIQDKVLEEAYAEPRLWGIGRRDIVTAFSRTLIPIIPSITGFPDKASKVLSEVFETRDPRSIKWREIRIDKDKEYTSRFIKTIYRITQDDQITSKILGNFYIYLREGDPLSEVEAYELIGSILVYESLCAKCPVDVALIAFEKNIIPQILSIYDRVIDKVAYLISSNIEKLKIGEPVNLENIVKRPDLAIDILSNTTTLPKNNTVKIYSDGVYVTALRELIRVGWKPGDAYRSCGDDQLCRAT